MTAADYPPHPKTGRTFERTIFSHSYRNLIVAASSSEKHRRIILRISRRAELRAAHQGTFIFEGPRAKRISWAFFPGTKITGQETKRKSRADSQRASPQKGHAKSLKILRAKSQKQIPGLLPRDKANPQAAPRVIVVVGKQQPSILVVEPRAATSKCRRNKRQVPLPFKPSAEGDKTGRRRPIYFQG